MTSKKATGLWELEGVCSPAQAPWGGGDHETPGKAMALEAAYQCRERHCWQPYMCFSRAQVHFGRLEPGVVEALVGEGQVMRCAGALMVEHPLVAPCIVRMGRRAGQRAGPAQGAAAAPAAPCRRGGRATNGQQGARGVSLLGRRLAWCACDHLTHGPP